LQYGPQMGAEERGGREEGQGGGGGIRVLHADDANGTTEMFSTLLHDGARWWLGPFVYMFVTWLTRSS
jgi:hypothetical protein